MRSLLATASESPAQPPSGRTRRSGPGDQEERLWALAPLAAAVCDGAVDAAGHGGAPLAAAARQLEPEPTAPPESMTRRGVTKPSNRAGVPSASTTVGNAERSVSTKHLPSASRMGQTSSRSFRSTTGALTDLKSLRRLPGFRPIVPRTPNSTHAAQIAFPWGPNTPRSPRSTVDRGTGPVPRGAKLLRSNHLTA